MNCQSCGYPYSEATGYANVSFNRGDTAIEKLQNYEAPIQVCDNCAQVLRNWLGLPPAPDLTPEELEKLPTRPFSLCSDDRLKLVP